MASVEAAEEESKPMYDQMRSEPRKSRRQSDVDGGWAWVVLFAFFASNTVASGLFYSFSIYYPALLSYFGSSRSATAWVGSLFSGVFMMAGPLATLCIRKIGLRPTIMCGGAIAGAGYVGSAIAPNLITLFFTYGLIAGFGCCLNYTAWFIVISKSFDRYRSLAFSLASIGVGLGVFILGPLFDVIIAENGWRSSFLISAGFALQFCVFGALVYPVEDVSSVLEENNTAVVLSNEYAESEEAGIKKKTEELCAKCEMCNVGKCYEHEPLFAREEFPKVLTTKESFLDPCCWCLHISNFFWLGGTVALYVYMKDFTSFVHFEDYFLFAFTAAGVGDVIGRVSTGVIIKITGIDPVLFVIVAGFLCCLFMVALVLVVDGVQMIVQIVLFGIAYGFQNILMAVVPSTIFGAKNLDLVLGYTFFFSGAGMLIVPPVAGVLMDVSGTFLAVLLFAAGMQLISCGCALACYVFYRKNWIMKRENQMKCVS